MHTGYIGGLESHASEKESMAMRNREEPMLRRVGDLLNYVIGATDGDIGSVEDIYFEDESWTVRYLVVDAGSWLVGRRVLITPRAIEGIDAPGQRVLTNLTREQVKNSPGVDTERPVSRQYETDLYSYYGYPYYWTGPYRWGLVAYPYAVPYPPAATAAPAAVNEELAARKAADEENSRLRSARDVSGHGIEATDGELGHVEDYLLDDEEWAIRYLVVDPRNWWPGAHVLIPTDWITAVHWNDSTVQVDVDKATVRSAPVYDPSAVMSRDFESRYHRHYRRPGYWEHRPEAWGRRRPAA